MKERKKDYWTSKSVAHARITRESRSQSHRSTPSAVLEDTMHLVDLFLSAFAPSWIAKGWMRSISTRVHKNKSMQHHTLRSGTAEFQVTWPPKLREGTYLVKNVRARFEYRKTIAAHEKQVIMQEKAQRCASLWRKTLRPKRVRFLAIDAPIVDYVCLPLYHLTFLGSYQPLCEFSWRKKKEKAR